MGFIISSIIFSLFYFKGLECCSDTVISFHYMSIDNIENLATILDEYNRSEPITFKYIVEKYRNYI